MKTLHTTTNGYRFELNEDDEYDVTCLGVRRGCLSRWVADVEWVPKEDLDEAYRVLFE